MKYLSSLRLSPNPCAHLLSSRSFARIALMFCLCWTLDADAQTAHLTGVFKTLGGDFASPSGVAADAGGDVLLTETGSSLVKKIPVGCTAADCVGTLDGGLGNSAGGLAVDGGGNIYVADTGNSAVKQIPSGCNSAGCVVVLGSSPTFASPVSVAVDSVENVYVADKGSQMVKEIYAYCISAACTIQRGGGFTSPMGVAVDSSENLYVADSGSTTVKQIPPGCFDASCVKALGGGFTSPTSIAIDKSGHIYVIDNVGGEASVKTLTTSCTSSSCVTDQVDVVGGLQGIAIDSNENLYVSSSVDNAVEEIMTRGANFGSADVATSAPPVLTLTFVFNTAGTLAATPYNVFTMGAPNLDFNAVATQPSGACEGGHTYSVGNSCTVDLSFTPKVAGQRLGAVVLEGNSKPAATAYVYGSGAGSQAAFLPGRMSLLGAGYSKAYGIAVDGNGNVYVGDNGNNTLKVMPPGCTTSSCLKPLGGGFTGLEGVAIDGAGNVYVADAGSNAVKTMPSNCTSASCVTVIGGGFKAPMNLTTDGFGNIYIADSNNNAAKEMPAGCASASCVTTLGGGFGGNVDGVAVDGSGNIFVADTDNNAVKMMPAGCNSSACVKTIGGGFNNPFDVAVDGTGTVYVADGHGSAIKEMSSGCTSASCVVTLNSAYGFPQSLTVDGKGNVYIADRAKNTVSVLDKSAPPSLSYATSTMDGETDTTDGPQKVTLQNIGNAALSFPALSSGNNPATTKDFTLDSSTTCPQTSGSGNVGSLPALSTCILAVNFTPATTVGAVSGTMVLTDNSLNVAAPGLSTQTVNLSGKATAAPPDFTLSGAGTTSQTVMAGNSTAFTFNIAPTQTAYPGAVTYTASGLPTGATVTFSPANLAANAGAQAVTMTVQTVALSSSMRMNAPFSPNAPWSLAFLLLPLAGVRRWRHGAGMPFLALLMLFGLGAIAGCTGHSNNNSSTSPPPAQSTSQSYTITVTATSTTITHTATVTLVVQ
jgi:streptogramin lyase